MGDIKKGDRFSVTVEGYTRYVNEEGTLADVTLTLGQRELPVGSFPLVGATKLASPLKVGDKIEGKQAFLDLPVGAVVGDGKAKHNLLRTAKGFAQADGIHYPHDDGPEFTRKILFLPES